MINQNLVCKILINSKSMGQLQLGLNLHFSYYVDSERFRDKQDTIPMASSSRVNKFGGYHGTYLFLKSNLISVIFRLFRIYNFKNSITSVYMLFKAA